MSTPHEQLHALCACRHALHCRASRPCALRREPGYKASEVNTAHSTLELPHAPAFAPSRPKQPCQMPMLCTQQALLLTHPSHPPTHPASLPTHPPTRSSSRSFSASTRSPRCTRSSVACWQVGMTKMPAAVGDGASRWVGSGSCHAQGTGHLRRSGGCRYGAPPLGPCQARPRQGPTVNVGARKYCRHILLVPPRALCAQAAGGSGRWAAGRRALPSLPQVLPQVRQYSAIMPQLLLTEPSIYRGCCTRAPRGWW